jgi:replicative DNA helicase
VIELILLRYLLSLPYYQKNRESIRIRKEDRELSSLYRILDSLMEEYGRDITLSEFQTVALTRHPELETMVNHVVSADVGPDMLPDLIKQAIQRSLSHEVALLAIECSEGRKDPSELVNFLQKFSESEEKVTGEEQFVTDDIEELYNETVHRPGLRWRLKALNQSLGSLRKGDFGFIMARPETGKTTFLASEVSFMAEQIPEEGGPILWCNNEEGGNKVKVRVIQATLGCTTKQMFTHRQRAIEKYMALTKGKIKLKDSASLSKREVEALCASLKPSLVVFDQIDKIKGFNADREDLRLGAIYIWARELAKQYCPVIGVCQADVSGEGKKYLTMENVANAKTSKQAEADFILGIGTVHDEGLKYIRYLHLSKNKLSGDADTLPEMRHGRFEVLIQPEQARYSDLT